MSSYNFDGIIPVNAIAGEYDSQNGEFTGRFFYTLEDAEKAEKRIISNSALSVEEVNESGWVGSK